MPSAPQGGKEANTSLDNGHIPFENRRLWPESADGAEALEGCTITTPHDARAVESWTERTDLLGDGPPVAHHQDWPINTSFVGQRGGLARRSPYAGAGSKLTSGSLGGHG